MRHSKSKKEQPTVLPDLHQKKLDFFASVYEVVRAIPKGRVTSYGAIAAALGAKSSSRMVGFAMNSSHHVLPPVPAHRVVNRNGLLTGKHHFGAPEMMAELLRSEGVEVKEDQVLNFHEVFWNPEELLSTE